MDHKVTTDYTRSLGNANVKVYVRARPCADGQSAPEDMFERKKETPSNIVIKDTERMQYGNHAFSFDNVLYNGKVTSKSLVDYALKGINSCCFAYGQTGSGKTFSKQNDVAMLMKCSIFGEPGGVKAGLLSRSIEYLFEMVNRQQSKSKEVTLVVSFLEIYCDRVRDLARAYLKKTGRPVSYQTSSSAEWFLRQQQQQQIPRTESAARYCTHLQTNSQLQCISLTALVSSFSSNPPKAEEDYDYEKANYEIHEDAQGRVFVKDLSMVTVTSREEVDAIIQCGLKLRSTHETKMNAVSSRSHTVFTIHVFQQVRDTEEVIYGMLNMVDLAGSERLKKSESDGQRLKEALHINSSLSAVGKVVMSLDPESGYNYIPYRDSKLTRLLQNSIGGNCFTTLIATIHPMKEHYEECLGTLQFANRCRSVQNQPRVNHINGTIADKDRRIRKLQEELGVLRRQLEGLRTEYNNRFVTTLNELGFQAEEISENGEIKFADGLVLKSVFSDGEPGGNAPASSALFKNKHPGTTGHVQSLLRANVEETRNDRDRLRQKYANAKSNFTVVVTEAKKEKENARCVINDLRRRITTLESCLQQKSSEYERALASEAARHRAEMLVLLSRNNHTNTGMEGQMLYQQTSTSFINPHVDAGEDREKQFEQKLRQRVAALQKAKENEIALIRQQYDQSLKNKTEELNTANIKLQRLEETTTATMDNIREDCLELYTYVGRVVSAVDTSQRTLSLPKNILADPTKLRHVKAIMTTVAARLHLQHPRSAAQLPSAINRSKVSRPLSAPVRRTKSTYAAALRDRVNQPLVNHLTFDDEHDGCSDDGLSSQSATQELQRTVGAEETVECQRLMKLLEEEVRFHVVLAVERIDNLRAVFFTQRKKTRALKAANTALSRQKDCNSLRNGGTK
ncbi:Kinesin-like protein KIN-4A [Phytophthora citrophthora]|uniref:Kinesin-like protein n=1 Tax=Phytophthora citrophthora TaxID=4793 RepID=A0AAD9LLT3_9STRA|nr:Kinesin-like protein KIN-4A [Phytophthora citrophthora]